LNVTGTINTSLNGTGTTVTKTGITAGTYNISVTNDQSCTSNATDIILVETRPATPTVPIVGTITPPNCNNSTGSVVLSGLPLGEWTINPGQFTGSGESYTVTGLASGTYQFTVTNDQLCVSSATSVVIITVAPEVPVAPLIGAITQPSCTLATGSVILNGLPTGNWTINPGGYTGSGTSYTVIGLIAGTFQFTVTNAQGCISSLSEKAIIESQPKTPLTPIIETISQPTCAIGTGSVILRGLPTGSWTINPGAISGTGTHYTVSGLIAGTYNFTVTNAEGCISIPTTNVVINTQPITPSAPLIGTITQLTCTSAVGSITLNGLPSGNWTIYPQVISGTGSNYTVTNLKAGTYQFTVINSVGCMSGVSANATINPQPVTPTAPKIERITQPTCDLVTGTILLNNLPSGTWIINPGGITGSGSSYEINGLNAGNYNYTVTQSSGCTSIPSATATINTPPAVPMAPIVIVENKTVTIQGVTGETYSIDNGNFTSILVYEDLSIGEHTFIAKNNEGCISPITTIVIEEAIIGDGSEFIIYNGVSPNGDGKNDFFHIKYLENYPDNSVEIFDASGKYVYKAKNYDNKKVLFTGSELTIGVYYYIIRYVDKSSRTRTLTGNLYINR
jgi:gliding motility-associated-like protein